MVTELFRRIWRWIKVKDCKHCCIFCEYYEICEGTEKGEI